MQSVRRRAVDRGALRPAVLVVLLAATFLPPAPAHGQQTLQARFQHELDVLRDRHGFPGATAAYALPDGTVGVAATGLADLERGTPMAPSSRMLAASIGKSFVAATVLALAEDGSLRLDDRLDRWLGDRPWLPRLPNHTTITLDHLLRHTAGIPDHVYSPEFATVWSRRWTEPGQPFPPESLIAFILDQPPLFEPGAGWSYSDTGYLILGLVAEEASGRSLFDLVTERFLVPLRLGLTTPSDRRILPGLAAGYMAADNDFGLPAKTTVAPGILAWHPGVEWAGGGLVSSPADLVLWARTLYEGRALDGPYLDDLFRSAPIGGDPSARYGAGVAIRGGGAMGPVWGHAGRIPGYTSSMRYYPDHRIAVAFQINTDGGIGGSPGMDYVGEMERRLAETVASASGR